MTIGASAAGAKEMTFGPWTNLFRSGEAARPEETTWTINSTFAPQNPGRTDNVYFYDSVVGGGVNYDHGVVSSVGKTGASGLM